jgi:hypothetical protein
MSDDPTFDRTARIWLDEGPGSAPESVLQSALLAIETTPMERDLRIPWRHPPMIRTSFAALALGAIVVVGGAAIWLNQSPRSLPAGGVTPTHSASPPPTAAPTTAPATPAPSPSTLPAATGELTAGTRYTVPAFSQPMSFVEPGFPTADGTPTGDAWADGNTWRVRVNPLWAVTIHDDIRMGIDLCKAESGTRDLPDTPEAIGAWLAGSSETTLSAPMSLQVDGRTATAWDVTFGTSCAGSIAGEVYMSANDHHRFYAIPTGTDTILAITWDSDLAATDQLVESMTFP